MADPHAAPAASPSPAPSSGGAGNWQDIVTSLGFWAFVIRYMPGAVPLMAEIRDKVAQGVEAFQKWMSELFGRIVARWGWILTLLLAAVAYGSWHLLIFLSGKYSAPTNFDALETVAETSDFAIYMALTCAAIQLITWIVPELDLVPPASPASPPTPGVKQKKTWQDRVRKAQEQIKEARGTVFFLVMIVMDVVMFALSLTFINYAIVIGEQAAAGATFVDIARDMVFPRWVLAIAAGVLLSTLPSHLMVKFFTWLFAAAIWSAEAGAGAFAGTVGPAAFAGWTAKDFKSTVAKVHDALNEQGIRQAIAKVLSSIWLLLVWICLVTSLHVTGAFLTFALMSAIITVAVEYFASARGNQAEVDKRKKAFGLKMLAFGTFLIIWIGIQLFCPQLVAKAIYFFTTTLPGLTHDAACLNQGLADKFFEKDAWTFSILCSLLVLAIGPAWFMIWHHGAKDHKDALKRILATVAVLVGVWAFALLLSTVFIKDRWSALALQGCSVAGTSVITVTSAAPYPPPKTEETSVPPRDKDGYTVGTRRTSAAIDALNKKKTPR